jgi:hypothetical protein
MARVRDVFTTIRSEGALLPPDFLQRIAEGDKEIAGLTPDSYHLQEREKLSEAITRSWNRLLGFWSAFQSASGSLGEGEPATGLTRDKWLLPLFQELGYGRLPAGKGFEIEGKAYPISHVWQNTPIHLLGRNVDLDRPTKGVAGAARHSPHGLVQEFLNRHEGHLWGFLSNGLKLRILRDNKSLTRQAYVEFDLAGMMDGQLYADFALLWLLCHQSRVEAEEAEQCWLEKWSEAARKGGTRALDTLRDGVQQAIEALGRGFLAYPTNKELLDRLRNGALDKQDYYRQLLRTVYRLIFLFVAEDRDLLLTAPHGAKERKRYLEHYSAQRLRALAERRRGSPHPDLWQGLRLVFARLSSENGSVELGLPALGSFLWSDKATPDLDRCSLANTDLLAAVRSLAFTLDGKVRRVIDYRNLGAEELGSVYESLLELHPDVNAEAPTFELKVAAGHERKTTGSYYTPTSLIECLLDSALDPVLQEAAKQPDPEKAILDLKVCDPACGSGHFLIAAAHRMANRLAAVRTGDEEPSPEAVRKALRDIVGRCLYGVDINPMAVELCKVNLWLEALEPGKPLSFLEHHIQCGNSLLGATPALLKKGIPDEAFEPLEGDDKAICRIFKKKNKAEREGHQVSLLEMMHEPWDRLGDLATALADLDAITDDTPEGQRAKQDRWEQLVRSNSYEFGRLWADAWCTAFVWKKVDDPNLPYPITETVFRKMEKNPFSVPDWMREGIRRLAADYQFLHWHLAFPRVFRVTDGRSEEGPGWIGGFDIVIGNPPWEQQQVSEQEFFADRAPAIAAAVGAARKELIEDLRVANPALYAAFLAAQRRLDGENQLTRASGRYPLCGRGKLNTYAIFAELNRSVLGSAGRAGFIVPSGIATDDTTKAFFQQLIQQKSLVSLFDFRNRGFFPGAAGAQGNRFCLLSLTGRERPHGEPEFFFRGEAVAELSDADRRFRLLASDLSLLNPNTRTCPIFRTRRDAEITKAIYRRIPVLVNENKGEAADAWGVELRQGLFNMTGDSRLFRTQAQLESDGWQLEGNVFRKGSERYLPLYEAKMVHHFHHRFGDYSDKDEGERTETTRALPDVPASRLVDTHYAPLPRYWVPKPDVEERLRDRWDREWLLGWRDICSGLDERTVIASIIPRVAAGHSFPLLFSPRPPRYWPGLLANLCSFAFDYVARQKLGGTHLTFFILKQLPVIHPDTYSQPSPWAPGMTLGDWIRSRVLELAYTSSDLQPFASDLGHEGPPFLWDPERRFQLRCELDAAFFHLYGLDRAETGYIMDTFPIIHQSEQAAFASYRTKTAILIEWDHLAHGEPSGQSALARPAAGAVSERL